METTAYAVTRDVAAPFDEVVERVRAALAEEGFGVLTTIDVQATLHEKLGAEVEPYVILGACNPHLASRGLALEPDLGVLLPCNVVVRVADGTTHVAAMEPMAALALAGNDALEPLAREARERVLRAVASL
ncbi:MAG: DUF302 domain-containing protein [Thermoleophilia bacterium]|nr:DUF302 domain-containing protein [Thermoleophilia bacterium]MDH5332341.1 DUF302 domain-containing protein [Thermoleophilia bacterium]